MSMEDDDTNDGKTKNKKKLSPVPCGKNDVFTSSLLSPMDKRRLMKFLQTALYFATAEALKEADETGGDDNDPTNVGATTTTTTTTAVAVEGWNELHLNQGRSLSRPQNKAGAKYCAVGVRRTTGPSRGCLHEYTWQTNTSTSHSNTNDSNYNNNSVTTATSDGLGSLLDDDKEIL
jgi:hypothetical protein